MNKAFKEYIFYFKMQEDKTAYECKFCKKIFSSSSNINRHQKTAKFCLLIQQKDITEEAFQCKHCKYNSKLKNNYIKHTQTCKFAKQSTEQKFREMELDLAVERAKVKMYEKQIIPKLSKEAFKPKTSNVTFNMQVAYCQEKLSPYEDFSKGAKALITTHFTYSYFKKGVDGVILLINKILTSDDKRYLISFDNSKHTFFRNYQSQIEIDDKANKLLQEILPYIIEAANIKYKKGISLIDLETDAGGNEMSKLSKTYMDIRNINDLGSKERGRCVKAIAESLSISSKLIKIPDKEI